MRLNRPTVRSYSRYALLLVLTVALLVGPAPVAGASENASNVTAYRATNATFQSAADVEEAIANGTVASADTVVLGDTLVVAIESERLADEMAAGEGTTTERFFDAMTGNATFRLLQTNPTPEQSRKRALLGPENVTVYRNGTTTYALVRTGNLTFRYRGSEDHGATRIFGGERFAIEFGYGLSESFSPESSVPVVELYPYKSAFDDGARYDPLPPEVVQLPVTVNVEPTDSVVARVRLETGRTLSAPVTPEDVPDYLRVWLDLRDVASGTGYVLELVHDGTVVDRYEGTVREPRARVWNATLTRIDGQTVLNVTANLSHGGAVVPVSEACERAGLRYVPPGVEKRLSVELWHENGTKVRTAPDEYGVLVRTEREGTSRYAFYEGNAAETSISFSETCATPTPHPLPASVSTTQASPTTTITPEPTPTTTTATTGTSTTTTTTTDDGPGFGVWAGVGALVGLALLARRRAKL